MPAPLQDSSNQKSHLDQISTRWPIVGDPTRFVFRYATAINKYLTALLGSRHEAEEVSQDFLLKVLKKPFHESGPDSGRFRDYLKAAVRNAAITHLRRRKPVALRADALGLADTAAPDRAERDADREWLAECRRCVLDRVWRSIEVRQGRTPGNLFHTVLKLSVEHPQEDSDALAARASALTGKPIRADAFRKQLSRARRAFAERLIDEVSQTLDRPTPDLLEEELIALGVMDFLRDFLPPDWRTRGLTPQPASGEAE